MNRINKNLKKKKNSSVLQKLKKINAVVADKLVIRLRMCRDKASFVPNSLVDKESFEIKSIFKLKDKGKEIEDKNTFLQII